MKSGVEPLRLTTFTEVEFSFFVSSYFEKKLMIVCLTDPHCEHICLEGSILYRLVTSYL